MIGTRALGVDLIYSDDCPKKYRAHGFEDVKADVDTDVLLFPVDERWTRASWLCGLINSGFHTLASPHPPRVE